LRVLGSRVVDGTVNLPEIEIRGIDVAEEMSLFLLDLVFEDADVVGLRNLHSEDPLFIVSKNKTVE